METKMEMEMEYDARQRLALVRSRAKRRNCSRALVSIKPFDNTTKYLKTTEIQIKRGKIVMKIMYVST